MVKIESIEISKLNLLENNPRTIGKSEFDQLCQSIKEDPNFFHNRPVLANEVNGVLYVYAGNQRVRAAKKLKWKRVPCIIEKDLSDELIKERIIKDNRHSGYWDYDILSSDYDIESLVKCGFTLDELHLDLEDDNSDVEKGKKKKLKMCPSCGHEF